MVIIPHAGAFHLDADADHHEPPGAGDPSRHDAETHTHVEWYTTAGNSDIPWHSVAPVATHRVLMTALEPPVHGRTPVRRHALEHPPPPVLLYLDHCSLLS
jgi:hypothetical protein